MKNNFKVIMIIVVMISITFLVTGCIFFTNNYDHADIIAFEKQLAALEGGLSESEPVTVKLAATTFSTAKYVPSNFVPWAAINKAVKNAQKYIILDLSDCTADGNKIEGEDVSDTTPAVLFASSNRMNIITGYVKGIILPSTLKTIGNEAFSDCVFLDSIIIPDSVVSIGKRAFSGCRFSSITIPHSVAFIGERAFSSYNECINIIVDDGNAKYTSDDSILFNKDKTTLVQYLRGKNETSYTIPNSVTSIAASAFYGCSNLVNIVLPDSVTSVGDSAFYNCRELSIINIPDGVTSIGNEAFSFCDGLSGITIPASVTSIGYGAFLYCRNLNGITVDNANTKYSSENGILFNKNKTTLIQYLEGNSETSYNIPNSVISIGASAFLNCEKLSSIIIPESVTVIKDSAFNGCTGLTSVTIPKSVTKIESGAFLNTGLTSVTFKGNNVKISDQYAFSGGFDSGSLKYQYESKGAGTYILDQIGSSYFWKKL